MAQMLTGQAVQGVLNEHLLTLEERPMRDHDVTVIGGGGTQAQSMLVAGRTRRGHEPLAGREPQLAPSGQVAAVAR